MEASATCHTLDLTGLEEAERRAVGNEPRAGVFDLGTQAWHDVS